jgi:hypothetical protein
MNDDSSTNSEDVIVDELSSNDDVALLIEQDEDCESSTDFIFIFDII